MWTYNQTYPQEIYHYGVKGMKWGVRRTKEQLKYNKNSIEATLNNNLSKIAAKNGLLVRSISDHAANRAATDRQVGSEEIIDALKKPLHIGEIRIDKDGLPIQRFIGNKATVNVNPDTGVIATVWKTGKDKRRKYTKKGQ